jgi:uncharacterized protein involved in exopolysaccharide biosynthesis/Mrp family chromosome partitioning ATPase
MNEETFALRDVLRILRHHRWQIGGIVALLVLAALVVSFAQPELYTAEAQLVIGPAIPDAALPEAPAGSDAGPLGLDLPAETQARILISPRIGTQVARSLRRSTDPAEIKELTGRVAAKAVTDNLLLITANGPSPSEAAALANGYARAYLDYRRGAAAKALQALSNDYDRRAQEAQRTAEALDRRIKAASTRGASREVARLTNRESDLLEEVRGLNRSADRAESSDARNFPSGEIITPASLVGQSSSPNPYRNVLMAMILGGAAGVSIALLREHVNDRVRTRDEAARAANAPVLAALPKWRAHATPKNQLVTVHAPESMASEAYRQLRRNLVRRGLGDQIQRLLVTSVEAGPETSETTANLAVLCARSGQPVIAISANFRHSDLHTYFQIPAGNRGLAGVLSDVEEESAEATPPNFSMALTLAETNLLVVPSGKGSLSPGDIFTSAPLEYIFSTAAEMGGVLIIEAPPVLSSDDAITLTAHADATLLIVRAGIDKEALTARAAAILETAGSELLGVVLRDAQKDDETVGLFEGRRIERDRPSPEIPSDGRWEPTYYGDGHPPTMAQPVDLEREEPTPLPFNEQRSNGD